MTAQLYACKPGKTFGEILLDLANRVSIVMLRSCESAAALSVVHVFSKGMVFAGHQYAVLVAHIKPELVLRGRVYI